MDSEEGKMDGEEGRWMVKRGGMITDGKKLPKHFLDGKVFLHQLCVPV